VERSKAPEAWTIRSVLGWAAADFSSRGLESPRLDAELLLARVLGTDRIKLIVESERPLSQDELGGFRELIKRRRQHEPVAYILGEREFYGRSFQVDRRVLVPRPDTETLVEAALRVTQSAHLYGRALDLCTGSGCVAISFALERRTWKLTATDASLDALDVALSNAQRLGAIGNVTFRGGDLFAACPTGERYDLIVSNPPYVSDEELAALSPDILEHEPHLALRGGPQGLSVLERLVGEAPRWLERRGWLVVEIGCDQSQAVMRLFERAGLESRAVHRDYAGRPRVVLGQAQG
jgi:release factor glutamine methyltransferase